MKKFIPFFLVSIFLTLSFIETTEARSEDQENGSSLKQRLQGKIILQVEDLGQAHYIDPSDFSIHSLGRPADAFQVMRNQGLGISNQDIAKIQPSLDYLSGKDADWDEIKQGYDTIEKGGRSPLDEEFAKRLAGRILLQVEQNGEAWYVNPENNKRYFLGRPADAFEIMRNLGLGISGEDFGRLIQEQDREIAYKEYGTVYCYNTDPGERVEVEGKEYLVVDDETIEEAMEDKERVCTSHVKEMVGSIDPHIPFESFVPESYFKEIDITNWDVSNVKKMFGTFSGAESFNQDIGNWDVSNVENMHAMFFMAESFNQPIGDWDVSSVESMRMMFLGAKSFNQPIGEWDVSNVRHMGSAWYWDGMFGSAKSFNQPIGEWDVSNVEDMSAMFSRADSFNQPIGDWDVSSVEDMTSMFAFTKEFNQDISKWNTSNIRSMRTMFKEAMSFNQDISNWNVGSVENYFEFDEGADSWQDEYKPEFGKTKQEDDIAYKENGIVYCYNADPGERVEVDDKEYLVVNDDTIKEAMEDKERVCTSHVTEMSGIVEHGGVSPFFPENYVEELDITEWDVSNVGNMKGMFGWIEYFNQPIGNWDVSNVEDMNSMFWNATSFNQDISNWDVSNVENMTAMFQNARLFNQPIGDWDVSSVNSMSRMFFVNRGDSSFNQDISNWDVSNVENMSGMFGGANSFNQSLNDWDVSSVKYMAGMFSRTESFNQDISNWDVSNVESMGEAIYFSGMFKDAVSFNQDISNWDVSNVERYEGFDEGADSWQEEYKPEFE